MHGTQQISLIYAPIPKSGPEFKNRCTETQQISLIYYAVLPDSGPEFQNHCRETPAMSRILAVYSMVVLCRRRQDATKAA